MKNEALQKILQNVVNPLADASLVLKMYEEASKVNSLKGLIFHEGLVVRGPSVAVNGLKLKLNVLTCT